MAGPGLEVFKVALYLSLPVAVMIHARKPEWYTQNVLPVSFLELYCLVVSLNFTPQYKDKIFPRIEDTHRACRCLLEILL